MRIKLVYYGVNKFLNSIYCSTDTSFTVYYLVGIVMCIFLEFVGLEMEIQVHLIGDSKEGKQKHSKQLSL